MAMLAEAHVLLADDHAINRRYLRMALAPHIARLTEAVDGVAASNLALQLRPQLLLLDIQMPGRDGVAALRHIQGHWQAAGQAATSNPPPAIALTADARDGERERLLAAGFDAYLAKPVPLSRLLECMAALLGASATAASHNAATPQPGACWQAAAPGKAPALSVADNPLPPGQLSDYEGLQATDGNAELLRHLRQMFREELEAFLSGAGLRLSRWELAPLAEQVHRLIASAGYCGARRFEVIARDFHERLLAAEAGALASAWVRFRHEALALCGRLSLSAEPGPGRWPDACPAPPVPGHRTRPGKPRHGQY